MGTEKIKAIAAELVGAIIDFMLDHKIPVEKAKIEGPRLLKALANDEVWVQIGPDLWPEYEKEFNKRYKPKWHRGGIDKGWLSRRWGRGRK